MTQARHFVGCPALRKCSIMILRLLCQEVTSARVAQVQGELGGQDADYILVLTHVWARMSEGDHSPWCWAAGAATLSPLWPRRGTS